MATVRVTMAEAVSWSVSGTDADDFDISNVTDITSGELTFKEAPNYEMPTDSNRRQHVHGDSGRHRRWRGQLTTS